MIRSVWFALVAAIFLTVGGSGAVAAVSGGGRGAPSVAHESGWSITSYTVDLTVKPNGDVAVRETIATDFQAPKHGIYRDIPVRYAYDEHRDRVLRLSDVSVRDAAGRALTYTTSQSGSALRIKIGDANRTLTGQQTYVIGYTAAGALNGFPDHDELNWNATGNYWGVFIERATATVHAPASSLGPITCFTGFAGSTTPCQSARSGDTATFQSSGALQPEQGLTVVSSLAKGAVPDPHPILEPRPRTFGEFFELTPLSVGLALAVLAAGAAGLFALWRLYGRDRLAAGDPDTVIPEFEPPDGLRPAQVGLVADESADTKDVTATIVDLAGRGYLSIEEVKTPGFLHSATDYLLRRGAGDPAQLQPFESVIWHGLFDGRDQVKLSDLRGTFKPKLDQAESELYRDAARRGWFVHDPRWSRAGWIVAGIVIVLAGLGLIVLLGSAAGLGLAGVAVALVGAALAALYRQMPQRTGAGHQVFHHVLGYRMYMNTAERYMQQFAEKEKVFTQGLPYAIVFGCVDRWAHAFQGIDLAAATAGWYVGGAYLNPIAFSSGLQGFSNTVGASIAYVPASSGSSGFGGGGFSGGGFGGGGGGSW